MRHHNDLPVRLAQPDEIIELGINRPVIEIVFRLINKDRVSRIAQVKDQVKQHQTPFAWRHLHDIVVAVTDRKINQVAVIIEITQNIGILNALTKSGSNPAASVAVIDACDRIRMAISGKCVAAFRAGQIAEQEVYVPSPVKAAGEAINFSALKDMRAITLISPSGWYSGLLSSST